MKNNLAMVSMGIVSLAVGLMLAMQFHSNFHSLSNVPFNQWTKQETLMENIRKQNDSLLTKVIILRNKLALESSSKQSNKISEKLAKVNISAGFTPVKGPGITIILDDNPDPLKLGDYPDDYLIHDMDLLSVVNDLRGSGAEAISINDQRVVASTEIRCAGPTILVNTVKIGSPFEIKAIGNPEKLETSMQMMNGYLQMLEVSGIKISLKRNKYLEIPALSNIQMYHYAKSQ